MGTLSSQRGLQTGISTKASFSRYKIYKCKCRKFGNFKKRNNKFIRKGRCRTCRQKTSSNRFLQYTFCSEKEKRETKTSNKLATTQPVSQETTLQNGHNVQSLETSEEGRLGMLSRFTRCIFTHSNISQSSKISKICNRRESVPIQSSMLWPNKCSTSIYKSSISSSGISQEIGYKNSSVSRRLANCQSKEKPVNSKSRDHHKSPDFTRLYNKCRKIRYDSHSDNNLHRGSFQIRQGKSLSHSRKVTEPETSNSVVDEGSNISTTLFENIGINSIMSRTNPKQSLIHASHSNASITNLESQQNESKLSNSMHPRSKNALSMVVVQSEHHERTSFCSHSDNSNVDNRRLNDRMGGSHGRTDRSRSLVRRSEKISHKQSGIRSSVSDSSKISPYDQEQECSDKIRQYDCSPISEQTGRDKVNDPLQSNMESVELGSEKQHNINSSPHCRGGQCSSRQTQQTQCQIHRVVIECGDSSQNISQVGDSNNRSVCHDSESQMPSVLLMGSESHCICTGRSINQLGEHVCLCIPSSSVNSEGLTAHDTVPLRIDSDSTILAKTTLVSTTDKTSSRSTNKTSTKGRSTKSRAREVENNASKPGDSEPDCMEAVNKQFKAKGFSTNTRKLLAASWRSGTQKDYKCKFRQFSSWCSQKQVDPYAASLDQCANFLSSLFDKGLKYRTIAGYRSMLSSILAPIDKIPIGQHPYIIRLLKGVFNSRPPERKLLPEWDLPIVLDMLEKPPFTPMNLTSLKYLTWKTAFLIAITTFRRCSDLQSLRLGEGSVNVQQKGVTFIRHGLAKQDRPNHDGSKIFVPSFPENKNIDPKRSIYMYLKRTKDFREKDGENKCSLFLSINKPHKPVSSQTISKWIVKIIRMAYKQQKKRLGKVKGHSTRSIGPSWALFKGATISSVMESADWSKQSTFAKFYFKDVNVNFLNV